MAYGLQCWDASGNLTLDTAQRYNRLVYSTVTSSSGSIDLPEIEGHETVQWGEPLTDVLYDAADFVTRVGINISWGAPTSTVLILVFLYT